MFKIPLLLVILVALISAMAWGQVNETSEVKLDSGEFVIVEQMPVFPGGEVALFKFLGENTNYPESAAEDGIEGKVFLSFNIDKQGYVEEVKILRGVREDIDKEAIRVVKSMPQWTPATQRGKPVKVKYNLPLNFTLGKKAKKNAAKRKLKGK